MLLVALDVVDETIGAAVMSCSWLVCPQLWLDDLCQCLAQFNTEIIQIIILYTLSLVKNDLHLYMMHCLPPLVIRVDVPNHSLSEDLVLIQS